VKPVLKYPGAKARIADWVVDHFPAHRIYVEPFFGSGSVYFELASRRSVDLAVINDQSAEVVNYFRVMRERTSDLMNAIALTPWAQDEYKLSRSAGDVDELERARRFAVRCFQGIGSKLVHNSGWRIGGTSFVSTISVWRDLPRRIQALSDLLLNCEIHNTDAIRLIGMYANDDVLIYADPTYPKSACRSRDRMYEHEMDIQAHERLLEALSNHPGPVVVSCYPNDLYDQTLSGWARVERSNRNVQNIRTTEVLWVNREIGTRLI